MTIYAYIECINLSLTEKDLLIGESSENSQRPIKYRWALVDDHVSNHDCSEGSGEELFEWLAEIQYPIALTIPGEHIVSQQVAFQENERKHFEKMLPYELEENVLDDVDAMHFATNSKKQSPATVAYTQKSLLDVLFSPFDTHGFSIDYCFADYQLLSPKENEMVFWFCDGRLLCCSHTGVGFSTQGGLVRHTLESVFASAENDEIEQFTVYVSSGSKHLENDSMAYDSESVKNIFHTLIPDKTITFYEGEPELTLNQSLAINFCSGAYRKKVSIGKQAKQFSWLGLLTLVAVLCFVGVNLFEAVSLSYKNKALVEKIQSEARKAIPAGNIQKNPIRQLSSQLSIGDVASNEPSQVIVLLSNIAPVIQSLNIDLSTVNYSHKEKAVRLNIQADSFGQLESFRTELKNKGLLAELLGSNAVEDKFQARLRIQLEEK